MAADVAPTLSSGLLTLGGVFLGSRLRGREARDAARIARLAELRKNGDASARKLSDELEVLLKEFRAEKNATPYSVRREISWAYSVDSSRLARLEGLARVIPDKEARNILMKGLWSLDMTWLLPSGTDLQASDSQRHVAIFLREVIACYLTDEDVDTKTRDGALLLERATGGEVMERQAAEQAKAQRRLRARLHRLALRLHLTSREDSPEGK